MGDKHGVNRRSRKRKEFTLPPNAQKASYRVYLGDCGESVIITVTKKGRKRDKTNHQHR